MEVHRGPHPLRFCRGSRKGCLSLGPSSHDGNVAIAGGGFHSRLLANSDSRPRGIADLIPLGRPRQPPARAALGAVGGREENGCGAGRGWPCPRSPRLFWLDAG